MEFCTECLEQVDRDQKAWCSKCNPQYLEEDWVQELDFNDDGGLYGQTE